MKSGGFDSLTSRQLLSPKTYLCVTIGDMIKLGDKFEKLTVVERDGSEKSGHARWRCICDCGNETHGSSRQLKLSKKKSCGCIRVGVESAHWKGCGLLSGTKFTKIKIDAKKRNLEFDVSISYLWNLFESQGGKCALSGELIEMRTSKNHELATASLDRIDSSKGYVEGNLQWLHKDVNVMKWDLTTDRFVELCQKISNRGIS
jgi:hypothetical protein